MREYRTQESARGRLGNWPSYLDYNKMTKIPLTILFIVFFNVSNTLAESCPIAGTWKSHEGKTLENMKKVKLSEKQISFLSNDFFGELLIEIDCEGFTSLYKGHLDSIKFTKLEIDGNIFTTTYYDELLDEDINRSMTLEGDCYSVLLEGLGFSEVFCRTQEKIMK